MALASSGALKPVPLLCREGCLYATAPWFPKRCNCIVQELNCEKLNISGSGGIDKELDRYSKDEYTVVLILNDCKGLAIPKSIRNLPNLLGLYVYASKLVEWGEDAAFTSDAFASISSIIFVNTTLSEIPTGLLTNLASTVQDIEIIALSTPLVLPENLHEKWLTVGTLYLERCNLGTFPEPLLRMESLEQLSLAGNSIADLPESLFTSPLFMSLGYLVLSANPSLMYLPPNLDATTSLLELYVDATSVVELNLTGLDKSSSDLKVSAAQSPVCESGSASSSSSASKSTRVSCDGLYGGMYTLGVYPLLPEQQTTRSANFLSVDL